MSLSYKYMRFRWIPSQRRSQMFSKFMFLAKNLKIIIQRKTFAKNELKKKYHFENILSLAQTNFKTTLIQRNNINYYQFFAEKVERIVLLKCGISSAYQLWYKINMKPKSHM